MIHALVCITEFLRSLCRARSKRKNYSKHIRKHLSLLSVLKTSQEKRWTILRCGLTQTNVTSCKKSSHRYLFSLSIFICRSLQLKSEPLFNQMTFDFCFYFSFLEYSKLWKNHFLSIHHLWFTFFSLSVSLTRQHQALFLPLWSTLRY